jgi:restriction system protein
MAIPDYQTLMLPVLKAASDGQEHRIGDVIKELAREFALTEEEQQRLLPSGSQTTFANRAGWAKSYLVQAGLLEATKRAHFKITGRGKQALSENPPRIDNEYLSRFAEFIQFRERGRDPVEATPVNVGDSLTVPMPGETPDELLRTTVIQIETALRKELLDRILSAPPAFFERLIVALLLSMGYGGSREEAGKIVGRSGDGGIDGIVDQGKQGRFRNNFIFHSACAELRRASSI